jgi:hypothetical protein
MTLRFLKTVAVVTILTCSLLGASTKATGMTGHSGMLDCPHNTCGYCGNSCPGPSTWGICAAVGGWCECETDSISSGWCWNCETIDNWSGTYTAFHDVWIDNWGDGCGTDVCLEFEMDLCGG